MQNTRDSGLPCLGNHRTRVVLGVSRVHHNRALHFGGKGKLLGEGPSLLEARRVFVVVIEAALADRYRPPGDKLTQLPDVT
jgi:hypothetical protein